MLQSLSTSSFSNNTGNIHITCHGGAFLWPFLQWKRNMYYIYRVCVGSQSYPARNVHALCHLWPVRFYSNFSTLSHKRQDIRNKILNIKCVFWFSLQLLSEKFLIPRRAERDIWLEIYIGLHVKYLLFLSDIIETWIFSTDFRKIIKPAVNPIAVDKCVCVYIYIYSVFCKQNIKHKILWKYVQWESSCFHVDGRTDRHDEATSHINTNEMQLFFLLFYLVL